MITLEVSPWCLARWDANAGNLMARTPLDMKGDDILAADFSTDGQRLAIARGDGSVTVWNPETGRRAGELVRAPGKVGTLRFSADHRHLLMYELVRGWTLWDPADGRQIAFPWTGLHQAIFTPAGEILGASEPGGLLTWNMLTGKSRTHRTERPFYPTYPTISANGHVLAIDEPYTHRIYIGSAATLNPDKHLRDDSYCGGGLALTSDGRTLAAAGPASSLKLWDVAMMEESLRFDFSSNRVLYPCFSPDGTTLAVFAMSTKDGFQFHLVHTALAGYKRMDANTAFDAISQP